MQVGIVRRLGLDQERYSRWLDPFVVDLDEAIDLHRDPIDTRHRGGGRR